MTKAANLGKTRNAFRLYFWIWMGIHTKKIWFKKKTKKKSI